VEERGGGIDGGLGAMLWVQVRNELEVSLGIKGSNSDGFCLWERDDLTGDMCSGLVCMFELDDVFQRKGASVQCTFISLRAFKVNDSLLQSPMHSQESTRSPQPQNP